MADQKDRQQHAGISHHLHQPLEAGQRLVVQVMRLVDHQYDRALALAHDVAQVALAALGLLGNLHLGTVTGREIVEQRLDQRGQRGAALVDRKRLGDGDLARPGQLVLDAAQQVRLARSDQAGDDDQPAGLHGRTDLAHEVALMPCPEVADALERAGEPVAGLNVGEHQLVPRLDWNRSRMRSAMMVVSSVSPSSASMKARSASGSEPSGRRSWSTMAWRAASPVGYAVSTAGSGKGVCRTASPAVEGGSDGSGRSPPVTVARGSPSWSASRTTLSSRSSARLF